MPEVSSSSFLCRLPRQNVRFCLAAICFVAGAALMVMEITAYRLLAPVFGNTTFTWTALIGVILVACSVGGYVGGRLSERDPSFAMLGRLLGVAAVMVMLVPLLFLAMTPLFIRMGLIFGPLLIAALLFVLPGLLLGAVTPASVRLLSLLGADAMIGRAAGTISMVGTLGCFAGTLLAGFYLLSTFSVITIFIGTGLVLTCLASLAFHLAGNPQATHLPAWLAASAGLLFAVGSARDLPPGVIFQQDSYYQRIDILKEGRGAKEQLFLHLDSVRNGGMNTADGALACTYQHYWRLPLMKPGFEVKRAFFMGAGAFGMPQHLSKRFPQARVEVCEIDPAIIEIGHRFFHLSDFPQIIAHADDARRWLRRDEGPAFDVIFADAYSGRQMPSHLVTREFFELVRCRLAPDGALVVNLISSVQGPGSEVLGGMVATLRAVFPCVELFALGKDRDRMQNVILLATNEPWSQHLQPVGSPEPDLVKHHLPTAHEPAAGVVFTDDFNPMDSFMLRAEWQERHVLGADKALKIRAAARPQEPE